MREKHRKLLWGIGFVIFLLFCGATGWFIGRPMVRLADDPEAFRIWVDSFGVWSRLVFVGMVFLQVLVALIPGEPIELMAGYMFGAVEGTLLAMAGILLGSLVIFVLVRKLGVRMVQVFFTDRQIKRLAFLKDRDKSLVLTFILMMIPGTPKDLISYFVGLTPIKLWQWLLIVPIARIPSLVTSTVTGAAAGEKNYVLAGVVFAVTLLLSIGGLVYYRYICHRQAADGSDAVAGRK